ncbi:MAG: hypothetical protein OHK0022_34000 [Roseiflexaceae bacterium]
MLPTSRIHRFLSVVLLLAIMLGAVPPSRPAFAAATPSASLAELPAPRQPDSLDHPFVDPLRAALETAVGSAGDELLPSGSSARLEPLARPQPGAPTIRRPALPDPVRQLPALSHASDLHTLNSQFDRTNSAASRIPAATGPVVQSPSQSGTGGVVQPAHTQPAAPINVATPTKVQQPIAQVQTGVVQRAIYLPIISGPGAGLDQVVATPSQASVLRSRDGVLELQIPAGAVTGRTTISYRALPPQQATGYRSPGVFFELTAQDAQGSPVRLFQRDLILRVRYPDLVGLDEAQLKLYFSDAANPAWRALPSSVDQGSNTVVATSNHFTVFAALVPDADPPQATPCETAGAGRGAPEDIRKAFVQECETRGLANLGGGVVGSVESFGGAYAQQFASGSLLYYSSTFFYLQPAYVARYKTEGGPAGWLGAPQTSSPNPAQAPASFADENGHNFVGQDVLFLERGFIGKNGVVVEAHRYFPAIPGFGEIRVEGKLVPQPPPAPGQPEVKKLKLEFFTGMDPAPRSTDAAIADLVLKVKAGDLPEWTAPARRAGPSSQRFVYPYELEPGTPVSFFFKAARVVPAGDTLVGYAPCTAFTQGETYVIAAQEGSVTRENRCEGANGSLPPPDTTPPTIHYMDLFQDGMGRVAVIALVTDNRAVATVTLEFNGASLPMILVRGNQYEVAIPNGPRTGTNTYRIHAVDTSGNAAYFPTDGVISVSASQARNFGSSIFKNGCPCGYAGTVGDPVNTQNGNFTYATTDLTVAGVGGTDLEIARAYNSLAAFGTGGGTTRFTEEGGTVKSTVVAGPPQFFGRAWTFPYATRLLVVDNLLMQGAQAFYPDGRVVSFRSEGSAFTPITPFSFDVLTKTGAGYELRHKRSLEVDVFDAEGRLVAHTDRNGNQTRLTYDGERLVRAENDSGRWLTFEYNGEGLITAINAPEDKRVVYGYTDGNLTSVTDPRGNTTRYVYNEQQQLTQVITPKGHPALRLSYDDQHRVSEQIIGETELHRFSYSNDGSQTTLTDAKGHQTVHVYDDQERIIETRDALGFSEHYGYNEQFNRTFFKDRLGREFRYSFDVRGNKLTEDGPLGWHRAWAYNALDQVTGAEDAEGRITRYDYDARGNLTQITNATQGQSAIRYDGRGLPVEVRDFNDNPTVNTYDPATGDLLSTRNGAGDTVALTYDALGRLRSRTNGRNFTTTFSYDGNDNLVQVDGPLGFRLSYGYDANNNRETATDANGGVTTLVYNASEKLVEERNPLGFATRYGYDTMNNVVQITDAEGRVWSYDYDAVYNRTAEHGPEDTHTLFAYDAVRNVTAITRCNSPLAGDSCATSQVQRLVYDDLDRVTEETANALAGASASADTNVTTAYAYDKAGNLLAVTDANGNTTRYGYDALDRLIREETAAQQVTAYAYDAMGNLTGLTNPRGFTASFRYDAANRLSAATDALNQTTGYTYDPNGNLDAQTDPAGVVTRYGYDALDRLTALVRNERPGEPSDSTRNVTSRFGYDRHGNLRFVYDPRGGYVTEHQYDAAHRRTLTIDAEGGRTVYVYDKVNNLLAVTDANGHTTATAYDGLNRRTRITNPEQHHVDFSYDRLGNLLTLTDARGNPSSYRYDGMNRVVSYTDAENGVWDYVYDPVGNILAETDANRHTDTFRYDVVYRLLSRTDGEGFVTAWTYDANGNALSRTDGNGHVTVSTYDALDRLASRTNPENETTAYAYDWQGNQTAMTEADSVVTAYAYDPLYRLAAVTQNSRSGEPGTVAVNVVTRYGYDPAGNLVEVRDANGNPTRFSFDGLNRLVREVDALGNTWDYAYDKVRNRTARIDALRNRTAYAYYPDDQLKRIDYHDGTFVAYGYDENNNTLTVANELGVTRRSYDKLNRLTTEQDIYNRPKAFAYDAVGNRLAITYPDGRTVGSAYLKNDWLASTTDPEGRVTTYTRDRVGNVLRQDNPNSTVVTQTYDKADRLLTLENRQIGGANTVNSRFVYTYDDVGQRVEVKATHAWRQPEVETSRYRYDPLRRLVRDEDSQGRWTEYSFDRVGNRLTLRTNDDSLTNRPFDEKTLVYSYNAINQLLTVVGNTHPGSPGLKRTDNAAQALHAFRHEVAAQQGKGITGDAAADLLARADALLGDLYGTPEPKASDVADALAQLRALVRSYQAQGALRTDGTATSLLAKLQLAGDANNGANDEIQTVTYSYDANGNRINKEFPGPQGPRVQGTDYTYDPENRLVVAQDYQQNLQGNRVDRAVTTLDHDGEGRRLLKVYDPKDGGGGAKRVEYVFDGLVPIAEYNIWNPQYENFYRGDAGRILELHHFPSGTQGQAYWYHYDGLGSTVGLTKQSGQSSHNYRYEPYGQIELPNGNFTGPHNHYTFTGQELDEHTGLYEFYARAYDYDAGVWMTQDSYRGLLRRPTTLHRYVYVEGNPVNFVDALGFSAQPPTPVPVPRPTPAPNPNAEFVDLRFVVDFIPVVGDVKGFIEVFTGTDLLTGEELGHWRWVGLLCLSEAKVLKHLGGVSDGVKTTDKLSESVKRIGPGVNISDKQIGKKWGEHAGDYGYTPNDMKGLDWYRNRIQEVSQSYDEMRQGPWNPNGGGGSNYIFYRKGDDLVITKPSGEFVTMFPMNEGYNSWFKNATILYQR